MVICRRRRFTRKGERGTTVLVVVMVTTLITAIGIFAVRNISQIDMAVGFSRQSAQATALAELGTTAAMAQINSKGADYPNRMSSDFKCFANARYTTRPCYHFSRAYLESETAANNGETLLEPAVPGTETGSFGVSANADGALKVEMTERHPTNAPIAGTDLTNTSGTAQTPQDVTLTTFALVGPRTGAADPCANGVSTMAVKKVVRAHIIVPPN
ncbi:MAG TPA: hypothetical protein VHP33_32605 [Polyangiaceae bacterium]|nr:hypothetical protein [Polyangiaceae bacterium]